MSPAFCQCEVIVISSDDECEANTDSSASKYVVLPSSREKWKSKISFMEEFQTADCLFNDVVAQLRNLENTESRCKAPERVQRKRRKKPDRMLSSPNRHRISPFKRFCQNYSETKISSSSKYSKSEENSSVLETIISPDAVTDQQASLKVRAGHELEIQESLDVRENLDLFILSLKSKINVFESGIVDKTSSSGGSDDDPSGECKTQTFSLSPLWTRKPTKKLVVDLFRIYEVQSENDDDVCLPDLDECSAQDVEWTNLLPRDSKGDDTSPRSPPAVPLTAKNLDKLSENLNLKKKRHCGSTCVKFPDFLRGSLFNSMFCQFRLNFSHVEPSPRNSSIEMSPFKTSLVRMYLGMVRTRTKEGRKGSLGCFPTDFITSQPLVSLSSVFRGFSHSGSDLSMSLNKDLLRLLLQRNLQTEVFTLHSALKSVMGFNHPENVVDILSDVTLDICSRLLSSCLESCGCGPRLCLDYVVWCLEMDFVHNFQSKSLRRMRKSKICKFFGSESIMKSIWNLLFFACRRFESHSENCVGMLILFKRLLICADVVSLADVNGFEHFAGSLIDEYESCRTLESPERLRVCRTLLESVAFAFHRFLLARQLLEKWCGRAFSRSVQSLMLADLGDLLDAYFTDRFFTRISRDTRNVKWMSAEDAEVLVMLLYTLVESFISSAKDLFPSEFWRKLDMKWPVGGDVEFDLGALSLLPSYVEILKSFLENRLLPNERLSPNTHICLLKLQCLSDALCT